MASASIEAEPRWKRESAGHACMSRHFVVSLEALWHIIKLGCSYFLRGKARKKYSSPYNASDLEGVIPKAARNEDFNGERNMDAV